MKAYTMMKEKYQVDIGVLGLGPIAQNAHLEAIRKARNARLYAICDVARELLRRAEAIHEPCMVYNNYDRMLEDPRIKAVVIAVHDRYHVPYCLKAIAAGKHVLVEKPLGVTIEECEQLRDAVKQTNLVLQVGHNRRFEPGIAFAQQFLQYGMGQVSTLNAWYYDSVYRYTMQDHLFPVPITSPGVMRPTGEWKELKDRYFLLTHGSHLLDMLRFLNGDIASVSARHRQQPISWTTVNAFGSRPAVKEKGCSHAWSIEVEFANGALGHLNLIVPVCGDFQEGFHIFGEHGHVQASTRYPWFQTADVKCFSSKDGQFRQAFGVESNTFLNQMEGFAHTILAGAVQYGADVDAGVQCMRALVAISHSVLSGKPVRLADVSGEVLAPEDTRLLAAA